MSTITTTAFDTGPQLSFIIYKKNACSKLVHNFFNPKIELNKLFSFHRGQPTMFNSPLWWTLLSEHSDCIVILWKEIKTRALINCLCVLMGPCSFLDRKAGKSSHCGCLEPRIPIFHSDSDHIWETAAVQWGSAMLGCMARWLLLDPIHDHSGLPGVFHPSNYYQVRIHLMLTSHGCSNPGADVDPRITGKCPTHSQGATPSA